MEINYKKMVHDFFVHHATEMGISGFFLSAILPFLNEWFDFIHKGVTLCAAIGGIMLLVYSISIKQLEKEKLEIELKEKKKNKKVD